MVPSTIAVANIIISIALYGDAIYAQESCCHGNPNLSLNVNLNTMICAVKMSLAII